MKKYLLVLIIVELSSIKSYGQNEVINTQIGFYQKYISDLRNGNCPMYPSCSDYGINEFKSNKNLILAISNVSERLLRCGHEHKHYNLTYDSNKESYKLIDTNLINYKTPSLKIFNNPSSVNLIEDPAEYNIVKSLINDKEYSHALLELKRIKYFSENQVLPQVYFSNELSALFGLGEYEKMVFEFETKYTKKYQDQFINLRLIGNAWYKLKNAEKAINTYNISNTLTTKTTIDSIELDKINFNKAIVYTEQNQYDLAKAQLNTMLTNVTPIKESLIIIENIEKLKYKKPYLGSIYNIIPGLGYLYADHKTTALSSFLLNSLLGYATFTSIKSKNYGIAALTGLFSFSFYLGNVSGGSKSVKRYNYSLKNNELQKITLY